MGLLRSICCLFAGRCGGGETTREEHTMRREPPGDLGQKEAELERTKEEELRRMESGETNS